jgi:uncharacterized protein
MQPEERDLIAGLFGRLKQFDGQPRDPEAERLIADSIAAQPGTPYLLVQTVLVQEQALKGAQQRIADLEAKAAAAPPPSFLGSAPKIGPWGSAPTTGQPAPQPAAAAPSPFQAAPAAGGGFLRQAMMTAAGVAGGALLFEGIRNMMGHTSSPFGASPAAAMDTSQIMPSDLRQDDSSQSDQSQNDQPVDNYDTSSDDSDSDTGGFDSGSTDDI